MAVDAALQRCADAVQGATDGAGLAVVKRYMVAGRSGDLGDAGAHGAGADHGDRRVFGQARRQVRPSARVNAERAPAGEVGGAIADGVVWRCSMDE